MSSKWRIDHTATRGIPYTLSDVDMTSKSDGIVLHLVLDSHLHLPSEDQEDQQNNPAIYIKMKTLPMTTRTCKVSHPCLHPCSIFQLAHSLGIRTPPESIPKPLLIRTYVLRPGLPTVTPPLSGMNVTSVTEFLPFSLHLMSICRNLFCTS